MVKYDIRLELTSEELAGLGVDLSAAPYAEMTRGNVVRQLMGLPPRVMGGIRPGGAEIGNRHGAKAKKTYAERLRREADALILTTLADLATIGKPWPFISEIVAAAKGPGAQWTKAAKHLQRLEEAGLVESIETNKTLPSGPRKVYRLTPKGRKAERMGK